MAYSRTSFTVKTNGQTLAVSATAPSGSAGVLHLTTAVSSAVTQPYTITSDTTFYIADELAGDYVLSAKQPDGSELYGKAIKLRPGRTVVVEPVPTALQAGADTGIDDWTLPTGAIAQSFSRNSALGAAIALTTQVMHLVPIFLRSGQVVNSATFVSDSTALGGGSNQWFALYNSSRVLLGQTANDTNTAWAGNTAKTLSFGTPITIAYTGLHYVGIMVHATTMPTLANKRLSVYVANLSPKMGGSADGSLTDTAPNPHTAVSTASTVMPYCYLS